MQLWAAHDRPMVAASPAVAIDGRYGGWSPAWPKAARMFRHFDTAATVRAMEDAAKRDQWTNAVRQIAIRAYSGVGGQRADQLAVVLAVETAISDAIEYTPDPLNVELIAPPAILLAMPIPAEDCDGMSTALASALLSIGYDPRFVRLAWEAGGPDPWEHVLVQVPVEHDGRQVNVVLDPTFPGNLSGLLGRAVLSHVHEPIGRPELQPTGW